MIISVRRESFFHSVFYLERREGRGWCWEPVRSDSAAFIMPISATPVTHLISQCAKTESIWGDGNVTLFYYKKKAIFKLTHNKLFVIRCNQVFSEQAMLDLYVVTDVHDPD